MLNVLVEVCGSGAFCGGVPVLHVCCDILVECLTQLECGGYNSDAWLSADTAAALSTL